MHPTKVGIIIWGDLLTWQKLNVAAFLSTGVGAADPGNIGQEYEDAAGSRYLPLIKQPIFIYAATKEQLVRTKNRAHTRDVKPAVYVEGMFQTDNDLDNRALVQALTDEAQAIVGLAIRADRKTFDKIVHGLKLHP